MNKTVTMVVVSLAAALLFGAAPLHAQPQDGIQLLRGSAVAADDKADAVRSYGGASPGQQRGMERTMTNQPPMISHSMSGVDRITLTENQCLICHSIVNQEKKPTVKLGDVSFKVADIRKKSTKVSDAHMTQVDVQGGGKQSVLDMRHWQCDSCHVPQVDANPLVATTFTGGRIAR